MKTEKELELEFLGSDPKKKASKKVNKVVTDSRHTFKKDVKVVKEVAGKIDFKASIKTLENFIESVALLTVSIFTGIVAYKHYTNQWFGYFYVGCSILILLMGAGLFINTIIVKRK